jgi:DNA-binding NarL/FixJ family response regulator
MAAYHLVLADDHVLFREGLERILEKKGDLEVVGQAGDGLELLNLLKKLTPHMIILDISMPNLRGLEAIHEIKGINPNVKILILTMHKDRDYLYQAIEAGAKGYLLKEDAEKELFSAIEKVRRGGIYVSPKLSEELVDDLAKSHSRNHWPYFKPDPLSPREKEVLKLIAEGKSAKETADLLSISVRTAEHHRANLMTKLNLKKTADLIKYAIQKGYV